MNKRFRENRIALSVHYRIYSAPQALRDYIRFNGCKKLLYISHPLPIQDMDIEDDSYFEITKDKNVLKKDVKKRSKENIIYSSIKDIVYTFIWTMKSGKFDLFVGVDNINVISGLLLKLFGRVDRVVYYSIDYFPTRFDNSLLNSLYHYLDKLCVKYADETWNVSRVMVSARAKNGLPKKYKNKQYEVPIGVWFDKAPRKDFEKINQHKLIFVGHLVAHMGVDLAISALPLIIQRISRLHLDIIGGGEVEKKLKEQVKRLNIARYVTFRGWIRDRKKLEKIICDGAVGLAPFNTEILDDKVKNADPGKIKDYLLFGMPVVVTDAISTGSKLTNAGCGVVIKYNVEELAEAVVQLLKNKGTLKRYRENALKYIRQFDYNILFAKNLSRVLNRKV